MKTPEIYKKHFVDKADEREQLFAKIAAQFNVLKGMYAGSFVHITPSFHIPHMVYVDMDKRCGKFFDDPATRKFVIKRKSYDADPVYRFHHQDFNKHVDEQEGTFDLLISFYSGPISQSCKKYVKKGGIVLSNNSHGDAALAFIDPDYTLVGVVKRNGERFTVTDKNLDEYFITKSGKPIDGPEVLRTMKGPGYTKVGFAYLFEKV